jgi:type I restriction-modification system DNA methylase subunit
MRGGSYLKANITTHKRGQTHRAALIKLFDKFRYKYSAWQVFDDFIYLCAASLAQPVCRVQSREDEYLRRIKAYPKELQELFPTMLAELVMAFEQEGFADILGDIYMSQNFGDSRKGQYFTPTPVCDFMAQIHAESAVEGIKEKGFISVNDPAVGSGAMLIAFAKACFEQGINYQQNVLFVGQDVDGVVARMAFVQLSLLGCAGYIAIGDSLSNPITGDALSPNTDNHDVWFTPMFFREEWEWRRLWKGVGRFMGSVKIENI